jgi:5-methylcytosine-specific restriction endonuclease McrA
MDTKLCSHCQKIKPVTDFWRHRRRGYQAYCKLCGAKHMTSYRQTPQAKQANRDRWKHRSLPEKLAIFCRGYYPKDPHLTTQNLLTKFGPRPTCYLTGRPIDLEKWDTYNLDHVIPVSKGGKSTLDNCQLTCREANFAKCALSVNEFVSLCREVTSHVSDTSMIQ